MPHAIVDDAAIADLRHTGGGKKDDRQYYFHDATRTTVVCKLGPIEEVAGATMTISIGANHQGGHKRPKVTLQSVQEDLPFDDIPTLSEILSRL